MNGDFVLRVCKPNDKNLSTNGFLVCSEVLLGRDIESPPMGHFNKQNAHI
jgi:hypothetical protein